MSMHWKSAAIYTAGLLFLGSVEAAQQELLTLSPGHSEIRDETNGEVRVIARCVPARDLIEELAKRTGRPVVFELPVRTYASLYERRTRPLAQWLDRVCLAAGGLSCRTQDGKWIVKGSREYFDASLTESEILEKFAHPEIQPERVEEGTEKGLVIYRGRLVQPPYRVACVPVDNGFAVAVNGLIVEELRLSPHVPPQHPSLPDSGQFSEIGALRAYTMYRLYPEVLAQEGAEAAHRKTVEFLRSQTIIERVEDAEQLDGVRVHSKGRKDAAQIFPSNYDPTTGTLWDPTPEFMRDAQLLEAEVEKNAEAYRQRLSESEVIIHGTAGTVSFRGGDTVRHLADACRLSQSRSLHEAECLLREVVEDPIMAREMAANLRTDYGAVVETLRALLASGSPPESIPE